ncbi:multicopper oxidase domain-containing protein [Trichlorobacter lovleyi]|uniref:InlB B-repeat-containing protein n=1 Tax=Trichlorobacter lovleyi TaxID=313985 RepID=UPI00223F7E31|nr:multicopper oxidase domain-containing protein [Trichlorobacter lovleyi]QOX78537.1 multicopper oxidase domain-containing protein [Trichlorobacter lovleyi]
MKRRYGSLYAMVALAIALLVGMAGMGYATPAYVPPGKNPANYPGAAATPFFDNGYLVPDLFGSTPNWNLSPSLTKFVNELAPLGCSTTNNIGQCLPVAVPDIVTYPGSDYYEIELNQYTEKLHTELGATTLRGYRQTNNGTASGCTDPSLNQPNPCTVSNNTVVPTAAFHFLGPVIVAQKDRPVRIKLTNNLPTGDAGKLFIPTDTTLMGSGRGPLKSDGTACSFVDVPGVTTPFKENGPDCASYPQNRAEIHLHGGLNPWISDGTPHQWITPAAEVTPYKRGASTQNVPDMPDPGAGAVTYYYTNQQSARLLFYHDHAVGLTRLNVYAGEVAGYLIRDAAEKDLIDRGLIPGTKTDGTTVAGGEIPLIIMDKNFVDPATIAQLDPTWAWGTGADNGNGTRAPVSGDLWWPHVYMPAENPADITGVNPMGRWVYGLWFWPPTTGIPYQLTPNPYYDPACEAGPTAPGCVTEHAFEPPTMPKTPNPSWVAEAFMDTMLVNGTAYPTLTVDPKAYRFRILNGAHDRFLNLQLYEATTTVKQCSITAAGSGFAVGDLITFQGGHRAIDSTHKYPQDAEASVMAVDAGGGITEIRMDNYGSHYQTAPASILTDGTGVGATFACTLQSDTEVAMVPAVNYREYGRLNKQYLPNDSRDGGVPDPTTVGPDWIQIGSESGFLAKPVVLPNFPVTFLLDPTMFNVGNVVDGTLRMGPAERADVIIDFCQYAGKTLIMYNDAPAAYPAAVANNDYYTGSPDLRDAGGHAGVVPGMSPNTRTVMQIKVNAGSCSNYNLVALQDEFKSTAPGGSVFARSQEPIIVGQTYYDDVYGVTFPWKAPNWGVSEIGDNYLNYYDPTTILANPAVSATTTHMEPKAIHDEMGAVYDEYGRMSARLGVEVPLSNNLNQTFVMQGYIDPPTEIVDDGQVQLWKITHNGVDTHPMHFHLFDVQVINRVGWDGFKRLPDDNERGWKETLRVSPLEDTIVAFRPRAPKTPFGQPNSIRKLAPGLPDGTTQGFTNLQTTGPQTGQAKNPLDTNVAYNFGDEYVWHCHILSHEEQDMMRPMRFNTTKTVPDPPTGVAVNPSFENTSNNITVTWIDPTPLSAYSVAVPGNPKNEIGFVIERCAGLNCFDFAPVGTALANATSYTETALSSDRFSYRVRAYNAAGESDAPFVVSTHSSSVIDGICGSANNTNVSAIPVGAALCSAGSATTVTVNGINLSWGCNGINSTVNVTCSAAIPVYTVTFAATPGGGVVQGANPQSVTYNLSSSAVTAVPNTGYHFVNWTEGATVVSAVPILTLFNVVAPHTITANFAIDTFVLNYVAGAGGIITGTTPQTIDYFANATTVTATANAGYLFVNWTDENGVVVSMLPDLTVNNVTAAHTYTANFVGTYTVALDRCVTGPTIVAAGSVPTYSFGAAGFDVASVLMNGVPVTVTNGSYTFTSGIAANQIITASYTLNPAATPNYLKLSTQPANATGYTTLQAAYAAAANGNAIQMKAVDIASGALTADRNITVTLQGGYNNAYTASCGVTSAQGGLTIGSGTVIADYLVIK